MSARDRRLPDFFAVGPPRTGTTWLDTVLRGHVSLPRTFKETRFFDRRFSRGLDWYLAQFGPIEPALRMGEIAPTYFCSELARSRIRELVPRARIICSFRDPLDRLYSLYRLKRAYADTSLTFEEAVVRDPELSESRRYAFYLREWRNAFGDDAVLAIFYDDLEAHPQAYLDRVCAFLNIPAFGIDQMPRVASSEKFSIPRADSITRLAHALAGALNFNGLGRIVRLADRAGLRKLVFGGGGDFPKLPAPTEAKLRTMLLPEVEMLEELVDRDLSSWKVGVRHAGAQSV